MTFNSTAAGVGAALTLVIVTGSITACGSDGSAASLSNASPDQLAALSDQIAEALDAGDDCGAAHKADQLETAVSDANLPADVRSEAEAGAAQLVDQVNCESTTTTTDKQKHDETQTDENGGQSGDHSGGGDQTTPPESKPTPPGHGGEVPPGQAKVKAGI
jgi:hypothetical protein